MTYVANVLNVDSHFVELVWLELRSIGRQVNSPRLPFVTVQHHVQLSVRVQDLSKAKTNCGDNVTTVTLRQGNNSVVSSVTLHKAFTGPNKSNLRKPQIIADKIKVEKTKEEIIKRQRAKIPLKRPSHGKLKLANSCWQSQVGVCERHKNRR